VHPTAPEYTSVAPIFLERGRSFIGAVTSNLLMPQAKISINITELVLELEEDGSGETFVIVLDKSETEQVLYCDPDLEDPWGGCPVYSGDMGWKFKGGTYQILFEAEGSDSWSGDYLKVDYEGSGSSDCINESYSGECVEIQASSNGYPSSNSTVVLSGINGLGVILENNIGTFITCTDDKFYIYDTSDCE
jgi:hypothetical protein